MLDKFDNVINFCGTPAISSLEAETTRRFSAEIDITCLQDTHRKYLNTHTREIRTGAPLYPAYNHDTVCELFRVPYHMVFGPRPRIWGNPERFSE
jgi:hypothetical protein